MILSQNLEVVRVSFSFYGVIHEVNILPCIVLNPCPYGFPNSQILHPICVCIPRGGIKEVDFRSCNNDVLLPAAETIEYVIETANDSISLDSTI